MTQEEFEQLIGLQPVPEGTTIPAFTVIYFTANNYTPGYCKIYSIPTFLIVKNKKVVDTLKSTSNEKVEEWVRSHM